MFSPGPRKRWSRRAPALLAGLLVVPGALLIIGLWALPGAPLASPRPNVVLIVADDMRYDSLWVLQSLQRLGRPVVTFTRFYVTTPLCCPSRASIQTGLYAHRHKVLTNRLPLGGVERFDDRSTLATWLQSVGVRTGLVGRYLNSYESLYIPPGWDFWFAQYQAGEGYSSYYRYRVNDNGTRRYFGSSVKEYSTRVFAEQALRFLEDDRSRPFLLMLAPRTPHGPASPDPVDSGKYKERELDVPPSYDEGDVGDKPSWTAAKPRLTREQREKLEVFRRMQHETLLGLDRTIDSIADVLRTDGRLDQTWLIFTADNGLVLGEHRLPQSKGCAYEECIRVPLVVVPPAGLAGPRSDDHLVANIDLAPTIAGIMGTEPGLPVDGRSLLPLLENPSAPWRDSLLLEAWEPPAFKAVVTADRKYVRYAGGEEEVYDQSRDPYELENLAAHPDWASEKAGLAKRLDALLEHAPPDPHINGAPAGTTDELDSPED